METNGIKIKTLVRIICVVLLIEIFTKAFLSKVTFSPMAVIGIARIIEAALMLLVIIVYDNGLSAIGLYERSRTIYWIKRGWIWSAGFGIITVVVGMGLVICKVDPFDYLRITLPDTTFNIFLFFLVGGFIGPVAEEIFFRGILYTFFRKWGILVALGWSTLIFVMLHASTGIPVVPLVGGIVFAISYEVERNLLVPVTIHVLGNLAIFFLSLSGVNF